jgi:hypothetical protein
LNRPTQICGYADGILVTARNFPVLEALWVELSREAGKVGLVITPDKTPTRLSIWDSQRPHPEDQWKG